MQASITASSQFLSAFAAFRPMLRYGHAGTGCLGGFADRGDFLFAIGMERVDTDDGVNAGSADGIKVMQQISAAFFHQMQHSVFHMPQESATPGVTLGPPPCIFKSTDSGNKYGDIRFESAVAAFYVPEFFKTDIGSESRFR